MLISLSFVGYEIEHQQQSLGHEGWTEMLDGCNSSEDVLAQVRHVDKFDRNVRMNNHYEHSSSACVVPIVSVCSYI